MKWSAEAKVGLVTIVGVLLFTFVVLTLAHAEIFGKPGFVIHTEFKDANGLQKGNSVRYVGVHVGKVESVKPSRDGVDVAYAATNRLEAVWPAGVLPEGEAPEAVEVAWAPGEAERRVAVDLAQGTDSAQRQAVRFIDGKRRDHRAEAVA